MSNTVFRLIPRPLKLDVGGGSRSDEPNRQTCKSIRISTFRAARIFQTATSIARAARGSREISPGVMQWLVLCGVPYRGPGVILTSPDPSNQLPTSHYGAGPSATGRLHRLIYSLLRIAQATLACNLRLPLALPPRCSFLRIAITRL